MNLTRARCQQGVCRGGEGSDEERHLASTLPDSILPLSLIQLAAAPSQTLQPPLSGSRPPARGRGGVQTERRAASGVGGAQAKSGCTTLYAGRAGTGEWGEGGGSLSSEFGRSSPAGHISIQLDWRVRLVSCETAGLERFLRRPCGCRECEWKLI